MATPRTAPIYQQTFEKILTYSFFGLLAYLPFHAFITTWITSNTGGDLVIKSWKEILLALLAIPALVLLFKDHKLKKTILSRDINKVIIVYAFIHIASVIIFQPDADAAVAGIMINLRFLAYFILAQMVLIIFGAKEARVLAYKIVLATAVAVAVFGLAQVLLLPREFLTHFGYGLDTIEPYSTVDLNPNYLRISSTLRGPNPLGAYLILPTVYFVWRWFYTKNKRYLILLVPFIVAMFSSYSRSAWAGLAVSLFVLALLSLTAQGRKRLLVASAVLFAVLLAGVWVGNDTKFVKQVVFHENPDSTSLRDSNEEHLVLLREGVDEIIADPLGNGPGTAGPASFHNDKKSTLSENYYIQVAQEVGFMGMVLFVTINLLLLINLYQHRDRLWPRLLLASFAGLIVVNMLLHGWADETLAMTWWGLAGLNYRE